INWLIVAKMPLLISSRMTSAGLTVRSSASSLTVIVAGSSIAPRSRGSATWTCPGTPLPSRRGGFLGPRLPRVPLLLRATSSSFASCRHHRRAGTECLTQLRRKRRPERSHEYAAPERGLPAGCVATEVRASAGDAARFINHQLAGRRPHDPNEVSLRPNRPTRDTRPARHPAWCIARLLAPYDEASPSPAVAAAAVFFARVFFGADSAAPVPFAESGAAASTAAVALGVAAFLGRGFLVAGSTGATVSRPPDATSAAGVFAWAAAAFAFVARGVL